MGLDFIGNPYMQDELGDSDIEMNVEDDWITLPNDMVILDGRDQIENVLNPTFDLVDSSDDDTWLDEYDDDDADYEPESDEEFIDQFDPDGGNYEAEAEAEEIADFFEITDFEDEDDDDDFADYFTLPMNPPLSITGPPSETVKATPEETTTSNPDNADAD